MLRFGDLLIIARFLFLTAQQMQAIELGKIKNDNLQHCFSKRITEQKNVGLL
jgi:hypothetical protein